MKQALHLRRAALRASGASEHTLRKAQAMRMLAAKEDWSTDPDQQA